MSVHIRAGTSGFSFPEWKGTFYPATLATRDMLGHYASLLPTVEINNTFYRMPRENVLESWAAQVREDFTFAIKAPQRITHMKRLRECEEPLSRLFQVVAALGPKLGPVLFQLPPNLRKDAPRLAAFLAAMPPAASPDGRRRVALEFRHDSWFDDETFELLRTHGAALCFADTGEEPVPPLVSTTDWGYLRLRREGFSDDELRDWTHRITEQSWSDAWVFLKHEEGGIGPKLAARLLEIAGEAA